MLAASTGPTRTQQRVVVATPLWWRYIIGRMGPDAPERPLVALEDGRTLASPCGRRAALCNGAPVHRRASPRDTKGC